MSETTNITKNFGRIKNMYNNVLTESIISKNNDKKFLVNIYKILIRSLIDYSDLVIATTKSLASEPLQKLQNRALRICLNTPLFTRTTTIHN